MGVLECVVVLCCLVTTYLVVRSATRTPRAEQITLVIVDRGHGPLAAPRGGQIL